MSTLKVGTIQDASGGNPSTPEQIEKGRAKALAQVETSTSTAEGEEKTINSTFNVSSVTDVTLGVHQVSFTNAFSDAKYIALAVAGHNDQASNANVTCECRELTVNGFKVVTEDVDAAYIDRDKLFIAVFSVT